MRKKTYKQSRKPNQSPFPPLANIHDVLLLSPIVIRDFLLNAFIITNTVIPKMHSQEKSGKRLRQLCKQKNPLTKLVNVNQAKVRGEQREQGFFLFSPLFSSFFSLWTNLFPTQQRQIMANQTNNKQRAAWLQANDSERERDALASPHLSHTHTHTDNIWKVLNFKQTIIITINKRDDLSVHRRRRLLTKCFYRNILHVRKCWWNALWPLYWVSMFID